MRYEEAELELDNYIDQALLANLIQITIVHGIGTGVIREMVQKNFKNIVISNLMNMRQSMLEALEQPLPF